MTESQEKALEVALKALRVLYRNGISDEIAGTALNDIQDILALSPKDQDTKINTPGTPIEEAQPCPVSSIQEADQGKALPDEPVDVAKIVHAFCEDHDSDGYPFDGEEYDIELLTFAFKWLFSGNSFRLEKLITQPPAYDVNGELLAALRRVSQGVHELYERGVDCQEARDYGLLLAAMKPAYERIADLVSALKKAEHALGFVRHRDARWHGDEIVSPTLNEIREVLSRQHASAAIPDKCPDCGAAMIEVCSGLEKTTGHAGKCRYKEYVPEGYVLVPREPTLAQTEALTDVLILEDATPLELYQRDGFTRCIVRFYKAMIEAAAIKDGGE